MAISPNLSSEIVVCMDHGAVALPGGWRVTSFVEVRRC
jgi:hypothetical protein